ncbi:MAG: OmpA family protein [Nitrospira sp.]|nr:OmpA family protein [Nitrospira sp.]MDH4252803.1 OmpA family protein [Nitrospira sp.]MDH4344467.1 OmpA family protein [Nitrospira sp.]MDH5338040.1 OmpA family protein [Nitrospira sp.]
MGTFKAAVVVVILALLPACSSFIKQSDVCIDRWYGYSPQPPCPSSKKIVAPDPLQDMAGRLAAVEQQRDGLADDLETAQKKNGALSSRVNELERQLSNAKADLDQMASKLAASQRNAGDAEALSSELSAAKERIAELEAQLAAAQASGADREKLAADLEAANQRLAELEGQLGERDKDLAGLRGDLSAEMAKLKEAERGLIRALRPQINKGDIAVHLNNERLLINLASAYLFASGEDQLKPAGADALKQVGEILKEYPEYKVAVDGHTDNLPIRGALKKKFPTNMELSETRAANAAKALEEGGLSTATTHGYSDTKPKAPNTTETGRAKNRRVEIRVTK